jgi:hypothetical protein
LNLVSRKVESGSRAIVDGGALSGEAFEDLFGALGPHEPARVLDPGVGPGGDVSREFFVVAVR